MPEQALKVVKPDILLKATEPASFIVLFDYWVINNGSVYLNL
jgi:hypothetical protein